MAQAATPRQGYAWDNYHHASSDHHRALAQLLDHKTIRRIIDLRHPATLVRCLDVGAGGGSVAAWLAEHIDPGGQVVAADVKPDHIPTGPQLSTVACDLDQPHQPLAELLGDGYDLIIARLTLAHLRHREQLLPKLASLLAPGGVLLTEDWVTTPATESVVQAPTPQASDLYQRWRTALWHTLTQAGTDPTWGRRAHLHHLQAGLTDVHTAITSEYWQGATAAATLHLATTDQLEPHLRHHGLTSDDLTRFRNLMPNPALLVHGHPLYSTSARRPG